MNQVESLLAELPRGKKLAAVLRIVADLLEAEPDCSSGVGAADDNPRPIKELKAEFPWVTAGYLKRHVESDGRGPRGTPLYRPSKVLAAATATRPAKKTPTDIDPFRKAG